LTDFLVIATDRHHRFHSTGSFRGFLQIFGAKTTARRSTQSENSKDADRQNFP